MSGHFLLPKLKVRFAPINPGVNYECQGSSEGRCRDERYHIKGRGNPPKLAECAAKIQVSGLTLKRFHFCRDCAGLFYDTLDYYGGEKPSFGAVWRDQVRDE